MSKIILSQLYARKSQLQADYDNLLATEILVSGEQREQPGDPTYVICKCPSGSVVGRYIAQYGVRGRCIRDISVPGAIGATFVRAGRPAPGDPCPNVWKTWYLDIWCKRLPTHPDLIRIAQEIITLEEQITKETIEQKLEHQYNILRTETDNQIGAVRAEAERIITEIIKDYEQRDENVRTEADAKVMAARIEAEEKIQAVQAQSELIAEELRIDYARRDELIRAEAEAKIVAATAEERAKIRAETNAELAQYTTQMNTEIIMIKTEADARVEQAEIKAGKEIKQANDNADARIIQYRGQTDAEIATIKAEADVEIERVKAEAEAQMEKLRREEGVEPTKAPELAKYLPFLLVGGYLAITKKPEKELPIKK